MLFVNSEGKFIEIKRCDFNNDSDYYISIIRAKDLSIGSNVSDPRDRILSALKSKLNTR